MGLAAPRKRAKISHDPNNTNWARSTSGFGHKILSAQGWTPGNFLGAHNAAHADMFTAASASHIRVALKDDTLGLGARPRRDLTDEPTGLDAFKGLLGRLNGKSDTDIAADQRKYENAKIARYASTRWQTVQFISGGLLAQEKDDSVTLREPRSSPEDPDIADTGARVSLSTKGVDREQDTSDQAEKKSKRRDNEGKKDKKDRKKEKREKKEKEKKEEKEKKRKRKENERDSDQINTGEDAPCSDSTTTSVQGEKASRAAVPSRERRPLGRQMLRSRHIAQKKKALLDDKSLNEIFMVKS